MKRLLPIALAILYFGANDQTYAEIRNGYDIELVKAEKWIYNLNEIAKGVLRTDECIKLGKRLETAHAIAEKFQENHTKTQALIENLRMVDPELFDEINTIQDLEGNETHIYVKVVEDLASGIYGVTNLNQSVENQHVYNSEYGDYTVSVRVIHAHPVWALWILVHELGHVRYQVPHLAAYTKFYKGEYQHQDFKVSRVGHLDDDPSHQSVQETLKAFRKSWRENKKERRWIVQDKLPKMLVSDQEK